MIVTERKLHHLDASVAPLGRVATKAALLLRGKSKINFENHLDLGDYVTVYNAEKLWVTGNKLEDKMYYRHSGYIGNLKTVALKDLVALHPQKVIERAIYGMLPKNRLRAKFMRRLKIVSGIPTGLPSQPLTEKAS